MRFIFSPDWWLNQCLFTLEYLQCSSTSQRLTNCFFSLKHFVYSWLRHFGHWNISVVCPTVVLKLAVTVFFRLHFQAFWPKWLNFFVILKTFQSMTKKNSLPLFLKEQVSAIYLCQQQTEWSVLGQLHSILVFKFHL